MNKYTVKWNGANYMRISKRRAETLYKMGIAITAIPCKMRLNTPWGGGAIIHNDGATFESKCNAVWYYNCNNETGRYISFYAPEFTSLHFQFAGQHFGRVYAICPQTPQKRPKNDFLLRGYNNITYPQKTP